MDKGQDEANFQESTKRRYPTRMRYSLKPMKTTAIIAITEITKIKVTTTTTIAVKRT
jgi:hypothetical protein